MSTDIKIIEAGPNYWMPDENTIRGVIDLTDVDAISILNQVKISKGCTKRGVLLQTPIPITQNETIKILYINPAERRIEIYISKENLYTPIIFKGEESLLRNGYIKIEISSIDPWLQIVSGHTDRYGYSQRSIDMDKNIIDRTDRPQDILEYANLYNPNGYEGNMILSFSRDGNF